jgi:hypothetical protein
LLVCWVTTEWDKLQDKRVVTLVPRPVNINVVNSGWVWTVKHDEQGDPYDHKACAVAKGYSQEFGRDVNLVASPTPSMDAIRIVFATAAHQQLMIHHIDVSSAFLNAPLKEEVYMEQLPGFEHPKFPRQSHVYKLNKALYGLRQAPREWNKTYTEQLKGLGYEQCQTDACVFRRHEPNAGVHEGELAYTYLILYVDDLAICPHPSVLAHNKAQILGLFESKDLGEIKHYMGIKIDYDWDNQLLKMSMPAYCRDLATKFDLDNARPHRMPMSATHGLRRGPRVHDKTTIGVYATAMGALLWPALTVRPEIAYPVSFLTGNNHFFDQSHWTAIKHLIAYLRHTADDGITFDGRWKFIKYGFTDANWGSDDGTRKSQSGNVMFLAGGAISWSSKCQSVVALSTLESEFYAAANGVQTTLVMRSLLRELGYHLPTPTAMFLRQPRRSYIVRRPRHCDVSQARRHQVSLCS